VSLEDVGLYATSVRVVSRIDAPLLECEGCHDARRWCVCHLVIIARETLQGESDGGIDADGYMTVYCLSCKRVDEAIRVSCYAFVSEELHHCASIALPVVTYSRGPRTHVVGGLPL
jgi:hypothetical protein